MRILTLSFLLLAIPASSAQAYRAPSLDRALAGRTAGKPTTCITQSMIDSSTIFDEGVILYRMKGGPYYLNTPNPACPGLRHNRAIVSRTSSGQLCSGDILQIVDTPSGINYGSCPLGDFVPYARPRGQ
jgi:hypothetical protein